MATEVGSRTEGLLPQWTRPFRIRPLPPSSPSRLVSNSASLAHIARAHFSHLAQRLANNLQK